MESNLIIMKFGGSSVKDKERLISVSKKIKFEVEQGKKIVTVVSAQGDTTDDLLKMSKEISDNPSQRELDVLLSSGEQISMSLLAMMLETANVRAISLTGWQAGIKTCNCYNNARIINIYSERIIKELETNDVVIVAGFQGVNEKEDITTMGRGGSDTTAVALAEALSASECRIYTDVDGVYTADPRTVKNSKKVDEISYDDMIKLADSGAQVLNKRSVRLAKKYGIEISVLSSMKERSQGTRVKELDFKENHTVYIAADKEVFLLKINSKDFNDVLRILFLKKVGIKDVFHSDLYSLLLINNDKIETVNDILKDFDDFEFDYNVAKISVICANKDYIIENFLQINHFINNTDVKYIQISDIISLIISKDKVQKISNEVNREFNI